MRGLIGRKIGMSQVFDERGDVIAVTVVEAGPCYVTQIKNKQTDGYEAVQLGFMQTKESRVTKPFLGHLKKAGVGPFRILREFKDFESQSALNLGTEIKADIFTPGDVVVVTGKSKGRGFAGVVKRHHFRGGPKTHGQSDRHRAPGSIGSSSFPSRVFKGMRMAGRMGHEQVTVRNLRVVKVDATNNLILLKGAVPGANKDFVIIRK